MKLCSVCSKENSNYKCPTCKRPYCSFVCCKAHKEKNCEPFETELKENNPKEKKYDFPTEDTVALEKLRLLRDGKEVKKCLSNPHVRDIVKAILIDEDPTKAIAAAMTEPIFVELADACLKIIEPSPEER
ncbi:zinc finger HIT domain-containing protein 3 [Venturia canescens]|uniref:zinc finger HIT domain-containing protein 3 n=1 Tax=Venturia canescens TaxID=32260 RepID=UPI001C9CAB72|nr:zinc finger HIT domain-containing protein 3 [Venturia canescens]